MICLLNLFYTAKPHHLHHLRPVGKEPDKSSLGALALLGHRNKPPPDLHHGHIALEVGNPIYR